MTVNDIAEIEKLRFEGIAIPDQAALFWVFSVGWRKGVYFDFQPLHLEGTRRDYDHERLFGSFWSYLARQHLFSLSEPGWCYLFDQGWFPFIGLSDKLVKTLVGRAEQNDAVDILVSKVAEEIEAKLPAMIETWSKTPELRPHLPILERAAERFMEGDFVSATGLLYPRIEGILRTMNAARQGKKSPKSHDLVESLLRDTEPLHCFSWLLPDRFRRYLREVYFRSFKPGEEVRLSRHSVSHGIASAEEFNQKAACIGLLVVHQMFYFAPQ